VDSDSNVELLYVYAYLSEAFIWKVSFDRFLVYVSVCMDRRIFCANKLTVYTVGQSDDPLTNQTLFEITVLFCASDTVLISIYLFVGQNY